MYHHGLIKVLGAVSLLAFFTTPALAETRRATLDGFQENPSISTTGDGTFKAKISKDETMIDYELTYDGLVGGAVSQAHIHFSREHVNGAVITFLCGGGTKPDPCPASGTVTGTITAADVGAGGADQGIAAMELGELIEAMRSKAGYVNVHTATFPGGEVRGQVK